MIPNPTVTQVQLLLTTSASLFGLYGVVVALLIQLRRDAKFMGLWFRLAVCAPITLLAVALLMGLGTVYLCWWTGSTTVPGLSIVILAMTAMDCLAILWIPTLLVHLVFRVGR